MSDDSTAFNTPPDPMRRLFRYMSRYRGRVWFSVCSSIANKVLDLYPPILVGWVIATISGTPPEWVGTFTDINDHHGVALFLGFLVVLIFGLESLFQWMYQFGFMTLAQKVQHDLRMDTYNQLQNREIAFFEDHRMGETMAMLNDDVNQLERFLNSGLSELIQLATLFSFAGYVLFDYSPELALYGILPVPVIVIGSLIYQRIISPRYARVRKAVGKLSSRLENNLAGINVIKSFTAEKFESARVAEESAEYRDANFNAIKLLSVYVPLIRMAIAIGFATVLYVGAQWVLNETGKIDVAGLVVFSMMIQRLLWPLTRLGATLDELERAKASAKRTFGVLDTPSKILDPSNPVAIGQLKGEIAFNDVQFSYSRGEKVLRGLEFKVNQGETLGIAGTTGAGKSTLVKLLLRLYDVSDGSVTIDGIDIRTMSMRDLRKHIALVSQDVYLFHGTIGENIAYGMDAVDDKAIVHAAQVAHLHDFVSALPDGYETIVGEHGIKLSGGQRQRLSIARAILKDAEIMIFDEATSSVDTETEREIQSNLDAFTSGKTALIIAHRLSTIRNADRILVLKEGKVAEEGSHDALIAEGGTYADLWAVQSGAIKQ